MGPGQVGLSCTVHSILFGQSIWLKLFCFAPQGYWDVIASFTEASAAQTEASSQSIPKSKSLRKLSNSSLLITSLKPYSFCGLSYVQREIMKRRQLAERLQIILCQSLDPDAYAGEVCGEREIDPPWQCRKDRISSEETSEVLRHPPATVNPT
uniref:Uncharacterized protein n=1 Tax=Phyllostachys edulis TaxID=38705 RepID=D3IVM2_PHYED|nr:hypothetical protein [Phyllostachys edulis]